jgi:hypothetical protein
MDERYAEETQTLRELLALMHEHDLDTIKVKLGDAIYEISRAAPSRRRRLTASPPHRPAKARRQRVRTLPKCWRR